MISGLALSAFTKLCGRHSPLPYVLVVVMFFSLLGFGAWVFHSDARFLTVLALWLRIGWRKPVYDSGKHQAFALRVEREKSR